MCCCKQFRRAIVLGLLAVGGSPALAQETVSEEAFRPWAIGLTLQTDEAQSESFYTTFNWGVAENTWLFFTAGQSKSPVGRADIKTKDLSAGIDHNFGLLGASFEVEQWGEKDAVESFDYRGSVYLHGDRYRVGFDLERRDIDLTFSIPGPRDRLIRRQTDLTGDGSGIFFRADLTDWWRVYGSAREWDYSRNLAVLPRLDAFNLLSSSTLTLANSFLENDRRLGFEWRAGRNLINLSFGRNRSAVDRSELESINASILFPVSYRMDLEFNLGRSTVELFEPSVYGGVLLLIYGGS
jgi:hypothetical protein